jgi:hypothetical protein
VATIVVVEEHLSARADSSTEDIPAVGHQLRTLAQEFGVRHSPGRHHHNVGILHEHVVRLGVGVGPDIDILKLALGETPVDDADQVAPTRCGRSESDLAPWRVGRLEHDHLVSALAEHTSRLEAGRAAADDHRGLRESGRGRHFVGHTVLASGRRVCARTWRRGLW